MGCLFLACTYASCTFKHTARLGYRTTEFVTDFLGYKLTKGKERTKTFDEEFKKLRTDPTHTFVNIQETVRKESTKVL